jgi:hypothetical protein
VKSRIIDLKSKATGKSVGKMILKPKTTQSTKTTKTINGTKQKSTAAGRTTTRK